MSVDWNWFFSSLSQSAAAIVGIFGAFIITKIFSNQTVFHEKKAKSRDLLIQAQKISDTANSFNIEWYNKYYNRPEYSDFHDYLEEHFPACESPQEVTEAVLNGYIDIKRFSIFTEREEIKAELRFITRSVFKDNQGKREQRESINRAYIESKKRMQNNPMSGFLGSVSSGAMAAMPSMDYMGMPGHGRSFYSTLGELGEAPWDKINKFRDEFYGAYREAKHHSRLAIEHLASIKGNPESPSQISYALILVLFIFFVGVIYPLSFMPAFGAPDLGFSWNLISGYIFSFKGFLLSLISSAFTVIVALFFNNHMNMKYTQNEIDEIEKLTKKTHYCDHFKFFDMER
ncbi:hypothetical protein ACTAB1_00465 [Pseudomonas fragariae (ex Marin et al. 2024)]|nr:hypothetical protein [Pseudomonas syringae]POD21129.1 hypothetical protein BKM12_06775 [Pseudomonas syringae pv. syringae]UQB20321.1 hypothetical protein I9H08_00120 [Pseudomonas syringae pv. syringae]